MKARGRKKRRTERNTLIDKVNGISLRGIEALKAAKPKRNTLLTNTKRKKKDSKFIFAEHVVKRNSYFVGMNQRKVGSNMFDKELKGRVSRRGERSKETSKTAFNGVKADKREVVLQFSREIRSNNRFRGNHANNDES